MRSPPSYRKSWGPPSRARGGRPTRSSRRSLVSLFPFARATALAAESRRASAKRCCWLSSQATWLAIRYTIPPLSAFSAPLSLRLGREALPEQLSDHLGVRGPARPL